MTPYDAYLKYVAIKTHFNSKTYDYFKNNGRCRTSFSAYENRPDQKFFKALAKKGQKETIQILVSMFSHDSSAWIGDIVDIDRINEIHVNRNRIVQGLSYHFESQLKWLKEKFGIEESVRVQRRQLPLFISAYLKGEISLETAVIIIDVTRILSYLDKELCDHVMWPDIRLRLVKYKPWLEYDRNKFKSILKKEIKC